MLELLAIVLGGIVTFVSRAISRFSTSISPRLVDSQPRTLTDSSLLPARSFQMPKGWSRSLITRHW